MNRQLRVGNPIVAMVVLTAALAACSSSGHDRVIGRTSKVEVLHILVTNDDGFDAPGIDIVAAALTKLPHVKVTVVAPATNKSGTGSSTTPGTLTASPRKTASGIPATAVDGFPADTVRYALDTLALTPDLVVSGINAGQNLGPITNISGTVGAAKAAAVRGIPAIAASQGEIATARTSYGIGAKFVAIWVDGQRSALVAHRATVGVVNVNFPMCATGTGRGVKQVPLASSAEEAVAAADCTSKVTDATTDAAAFHNGFVSVTQLDANGKTATTSTTWPST